MLQGAWDKGRIEGEKRGIIEGEKRGIIEGEKRGIIEGKKEGIIEGEKKGIKEGTFAIAKNAIAMQMSISEIEQLTGLTGAQIEELRR
jgi:predicted transposase YdaD